MVMESMFDWVNSMAPSVSPFKVQMLSSSRLKIQNPIPAQRLIFFMECILIFDMIDLTRMSSRLIAIFLFQLNCLPFESISPNLWKKKGPT